MKTVYLVRHAKSSWRKTELVDIDRPLKSRGIRNAYEIAAGLANRKFMPEMIYSSPATRAIHTAIIFSRVLHIATEKIRIRENIYETGMAGFYSIFEETNNAVNSVMLFGHDPSITSMANQFLVKSLDKIPTCGLFCIQFKAQSWKEIKGKKGKLIYFDYPKKKEKKQTLYA